MQPASKQTVWVRRDRKGPDVKHLESQAYSLLMDAPAELVIELQGLEQTPKVSKALEGIGARAQRNDCTLTVRP